MAAPRIRGDATLDFGSSGGVILKADAFFRATDEYFEKNATRWRHGNSIFRLGRNGIVTRIAGSGVRVRRVTSSGEITAVAGNGTQGYSGHGGPAVSAQFGYPGAIGVDAACNRYIAATGEILWHYDWPGNRRRRATNFRCHSRGALTAARVQVRRIARRRSGSLKERSRCSRMRSPAELGSIPPKK
jgi:hypothetical protein